MARPRKQIKKEYEATLHEGKKTVELDKQVRSSMKPDWSKARLVEMSLMSDGTIEPTWSVPIMKSESEASVEDTVEESAVETFKKIEAEQPIRWAKAAIQ